MMTHDDDPKKNGKSLSTHFFRLHTWMSKQLPGTQLEQLGTGAQLLPLAPWQELQGWPGRNDFLGYHLSAIPFIYIYIYTMYIIYIYILHIIYIYTYILYYICMDVSMMYLSVYVSSYLNSCWWSQWYSSTWILTVGKVNAFYVAVGQI